MFLWHLVSFLSTDDVCYRAKLVSTFLNQSNSGPNLQTETEPSLLLRAEVVVVARHLTFIFFLKQFVHVLIMPATFKALRHQVAVPAIFARR
jgi:hypothetical protein